MRTYGTPIDSHEQLILDAARAVAYGTCSDSKVIDALTTLLEALRHTGPEGIGTAESDLVFAWTSREQKR